MNSRDAAGDNRKIFLEDNRRKRGKGFLRLIREKQSPAEKLDERQILRLLQPASARRQAEQRHLKKNLSAALYRQPGKRYGQAEF